MCEVQDDFGIAGERLTDNANTESFQIRYQGIVSGNVVVNTKWEAPYF